MSAAVKMPSVFSDNMLLQRGKKVKIWGTSEPRATVEVEFANQKKSAMADADGKWAVWLSPMKASANPRDLKVYENGEEAAKIKNVVVGELWILGGQSNMQWTLDKTDDAHVAIPRANYPNLRYFRMSLGAMSETPQSDFPGGKWELTSPENVGTQSAVGFYFGEKLLKDLGVPVGLINTSMGGTLMACWTPAEYIDRVPYLKDYYSNYLKASKKYVESGGYAKKLEEHGLYTMGDVARCSIGKPNEYYNEGLLYKLFGVNAELLIDHAWGWEPCRMADIKAYRPETNSISSGQVLQCPYPYDKARLVVREMAEAVALELLEKRIVTDQLTLTVGYDIEITASGSYRGETVLDPYGRKIPKHAHGTATLGQKTSSVRRIVDAVLGIYDEKADPKLTVRRLTVTANRLMREEDILCEPEQPVQFSLFDDPAAQERQLRQEEAKQERERRIQEAMLDIKKKYGKNAILSGGSYLDGATARERNRQIGGHKA